MCFGMLREQGEIASKCSFKGLGTLKVKEGIWKIKDEVEVAKSVATKYDARGRFAKAKSMTKLTIDGSAETVGGLQMRIARAVASMKTLLEQGKVCLTDATWDTC